MTHRLRIGCLFLFALGFAICSVQAQQPYKVVDHWKVGGNGGWDYALADPSAHLLYVTHATRVEVIDTATGKPVNALTGFKGTHGIALDTDGKFGYISDGGGNAVAVFDRHTFKIVATVAVGTNPDGIVFDPSTKTVWAFNGRGNNVSVIDAATNQVTATIPVPGKPEFPVADGKGSVYDNIETTNQIVCFDAKAKKLIATWKLTDCESPSGLALDPDHRHLFAVCDGKKMAVVDADSGKQLASPTIGCGPDAAGFSSKYQLAFSSNGEDGTVSVIDTAHGYAAVQTVTTVKGARTMAYDPGTDRIYLASVQYGAAPAPRPQNAHPRPAVVPDSFTLIVIGRK